MMMMKPLLPPAHGPPPAAHVSSRLPVAATVLRAAAAVVLCVCALWLFFFIFICVLLARTNTPQVHEACAGFWDGMLFATLAPTLIPLLYCLLAPCLWLAWRPFSAGCALILCVVTLHLSLAAADRAECVDALRGASPPLPLLLFAGYVKSALFAAGALTLLHTHHSQPQQPRQQEADTTTTSGDFF